MTASPQTADLHFYFDPLCPFAWLTSKWVRQVAAQRDYHVDWRFISLRVVNEGVDYASRFPPEYEAAHRAGLKLLRIAACVREEQGRPAVARLYEALGTHLWDREGPWSDPASPDFIRTALDDAGLAPAFADAGEDEAWDGRIRAETDEALALTGKDVGTPILHFEPPDGVALFGPVISRMPSPEQSLELWDHVVGLARFGGFAELKRSLRELPQLRALGVRDDQIGKQEDWHGGSRRLQK